MGETEGNAQMTHGKPEGNPEIEVADAGEYIRIRFRGLINAASQTRLIDSVCGIQTDTGKGRFIIDARGCPVDYPLIERYRIAGYVAEKFGSAISAAYIIDAEHNTGLVENAAQNRGGTGIRIVTSELDALDWIRGRPSS